MNTPQNDYLTALVVFQHTVNKELIRSLHVYRLEDGKENEMERDFIFRKDGSYVEIAATPLLRSQGFRVSELFEGRVMGLWLCIFAFHARRLPRLFRIPSLLLISRNPKLKSIPTLADDLKMISQLSSRTEDKEPLQDSYREMYGGDEDDCNGAKQRSPVLDQDLNFLPDSVSASESSESQQIEQSAPGIMLKKKKRATSEDIARIALEDLAKYFDLPIVEASRNLKVGLTVLKRKCREFGIPRWPHRKLKSLDGLIHDLQMGTMSRPVKEIRRKTLCQPEVLDLSSEIPAPELNLAIIINHGADLTPEEAERQQKQNEAAAMAVAKRQKMLEREKETIERKPFMEIESETKRFRQDIFKRRHRARALKNHDLSTSSSVEH